MEKEIQLGSKVSYLGIQYEVVEVTDISVKIRRVNKGTVIITVMRGSNRFKSIFPEFYQVTDNTKLFESEELEEVKIDDQNTSYYKVLAKPRTTNVLFDSRPSATAYHFYKKYCVKGYGQYPDENAQRAMSDMIQDIIEDETGIKLFMATCFVRRRSAMKFDFWEAANHAYTYLGTDRPKKYTPKLLEFYLGYLNDETEAEEIEYRNLIKNLPMDEATTLLLSFCCWNWGGKMLWFLNTKQVEQVLLEVERIKSNNTEVEEL